VAEALSRRLTGLLIRAAQWPRIVFYRAVSGNRIVGSPRRWQPVQCVGAGQVVVEEGVSIGVFPSPFFFSTYAYLEARSPSASIRIGAGTWINNNFCAIAEHASIRIGRNCFIGANVEILDSDFHGLKVEERGISRPEWAKPVVLGDQVFLGSNVRILKGVSIGDGSVVANGSVVTRDVPSGAIVGGNPAKLIRMLG
jgi:maltose O-acetyltransferase